MMRSLLVFPCVGCCVLLLGASSTLHLGDVAASVTSGSPDLSGSVRGSSLSSESSPLPASAAAVVPGPPSTTATQPQNLLAATAVSVAPAPEATTPTTPSRRGPISTIGTLLLSLVPGIDSISELFMPRLPHAVETATNGLVNERAAGSTASPAADDNSLETDSAVTDTGATLSTTKPSVASVAASTDPPLAAGGRGTGTPRWRVRRLQNGRDNLSSAAKRDNEEQTEQYKRRTRHDGGDPGSNDHAEEGDGEESSLMRLAEMKSEEVSTNKNAELLKREPHVTEEHNNDGPNPRDDAHSEVQKIHDETLELADPSNSASSTSSAAEKEGPHHEEATGGTGTTDESRSDNDRSSEEPAASPLPIAQLSQQIFTSILSPREKAGLARASAPSSPTRRARPHMPYYGGGPTFFPPTAFGPMPKQTAAVAPITVVVPPAPVQMVQAAPVQVIQAAPVQMVQTVPVQMIQATPVQMVQPTTVAVQPTAVAVQPNVVAVQPATAAVQAAVPVQVATTPLAAVSSPMTTVDSPVVTAPVAVAPTAAVATPMVNTAANTVPVLAAAPTAATVI